MNFGKEFDFIRKLNRQIPADLDAAITVIERDDLGLKIKLEMLGNLNYFESKTHDEIMDDIKDLEGLLVEYKNQVVNIIKIAAKYGIDVSEFLRIAKMIQLCCQMQKYEILKLQPESKENAEIQIEKLFRENPVLTVISSMMRKK